MRKFVERLAEASRINQSLVCVGLDPDPALMPIPDVLEFNKAIVDATKDLACAYKPNMAFYEALGLPGLKALQGTIGHIRDVAPNLVLLGDAKRGDVDSTNVMYARALFDVWDFDAATVHNFIGGDSLEPFFKYDDKGIFVLCRTSNKGAGELQDIKGSDESGPLYERIAKLAGSWNRNGNVGLVVGATYPDELRTIRSYTQGMPILIPGVGVQGGDLEASVKAGIDNPTHNILLNSSRGIIYASRDKKDFQLAAREAANNLRERINGVLMQEERLWS